MRNLLVAQVGNELEAAHCHALVIALEGLQELQAHRLVGSYMLTLCDPYEVTRTTMHATAHQEDANRLVLCSWLRPVCRVLSLCVRLFTDRPDKSHCVHMALMCREHLVSILTTGQQIVMQVHLRDDPF